MSNFCSVCFCVFLLCVAFAVVCCGVVLIVTAKEHAFDLRTNKFDFEMYKAQVFNNLRENNKDSKI